jgi:SAM-dependent methyltransferase
MFYFIIAIPFLLVILKLLVTNILVPHFKKVEQKKQLSQRADWPNIEKKIRILETLYKKVHAKPSSISYRLVHLIQDKEFVYGEIDLLSFYTILERASPSTQDVFYDLGSGSGKAVLSALLFFNVYKSIGIELLPPLYEQSNTQRDKAIQQFQQHDDENEYIPQMKRIQFINDSFLHYDFGDADIIYVAATCLSDATWNELISKMASLKPGSRIIVATRMIDHELFESIYQGIELMSWGLCPVGIYKIKLQAV